MFSSLSRQLIKSQRWLCHLIIMQVSKRLCQFFKENTKLDSSNLLKGQGHASCLGTTVSECLASASKSGHYYLVLKAGLADWQPGELGQAPVSAETN